jgi:RNA polymerase sigma-70 factor (ECF subfamily)
MKVLSHYTFYTIFRKEDIQMTEEKLIQKLQKKNVRAFEYLVKHYTGYVSTIVFNIIGQSMTTQDVEEVTADTFLAMWNNSERLHENSLRGYMGSIARNKAKNKLRELNLTENIEDFTLECNTSLEDFIDDKEVSEMLKEAIDSLDTEERDIFLRYYYYYQKISEISEEMDINIGTIKTKLFRGRTKIKQFLNERGFCYES